jgi:hypothetical protein
MSMYYSLHRSTRASELMVADMLYMLIGELGIEAEPEEPMVEQLIHNKVLLE